MHNLAARIVIVKAIKSKSKKNTQPSERGEDEC